MYFDAELGMQVVELHHVWTGENWDNWIDIPMCCSEPHKSCYWVLEFWVGMAVYLFFWFLTYLKSVVFSTALLLQLKMSSVFSLFWFLDFRLKIAYCPGSAVLETAISFDRTAISSSLTNEKKHLVFCFGMGVAGSNKMLGGAGINYWAVMVPSRVSSSTNEVAVITSCLGHHGF